MTPRDQASQPRERATAPAKITNQMRRERLHREAGDGFISSVDPHRAPRSTQERTTKALVGEFFESENEKNKENRPIMYRGNMSPPKRRFIDPQENAQRVSWTETEETQQEDRPRESQKRSRQEFEDVAVVEHDDSDEDGEDAYEQDDRTADPSRRKRVPEVVGIDAQHVQSNEPSSKRIHAQSREEQIAERRRQYNESVQAAVDEGLPDEALLDAELQASARAGADDDEDNPDDEAVPSSTAHTYQDVKSHSKDITKVQSATTNRKMPRKRKPWSSDEEEALIHYIGLYGSQWSHIFTEAHKHFPTRDQVALKDKARNMKVDYLK